MGRKVGSVFDWKQVSTPSASPPAGETSVYAKSDNLLYTKNSSGIENISGPAWTKPVALAATTASITLSGTQTVDGIALAVNDRVLVKNQGTPATNGLYNVQSSSWTRVNDMNSAAQAAGAMVTVISGTTNGGTQWTTTFKSTDTLNTTAMTWAQLSSITLPITVAQGGTGQTTLTASRFLVGNGTSAVDLSKVVPSGAVVGDTDSQTLTTKIIALGSNTVSGTTAQFNTALTDNDFATLAGSETLTTKTINLSSNTISGTTAQFNTALSDNDFATLAGTETLTAKTLTTPQIAQINSTTSNLKAATFEGVASAVNYARIINSATGNAVSVGAGGTDTNVTLNLFSQGSGVVTLNGVNPLPPGAIQMFAGASAPTGWLLCQGQLVSTTTYAALFAVTGHAFNGGADPGGGNFKLPDLQDRFPMGKSGTKGLGSTGGAASVGLIDANIPVHTHDINHDHASFTSGSDNAEHTHDINHDHTSATTGSDNANHTHSFGFETISTTSTGGTSIRVMDIDQQTGGVGTQFTATTSTENVNHQHTFDVPALGAQASGGRSATHAHTIDVPALGAYASGVQSPAGGTTAVATLNPYQALNYIIKT